MHATSLDLCLAAILSIAAATDFLSGRIPNLLTYPAMAAGLGAALLGFGPSPASAVAGFLIGGGILYVMFAAGWMGGGDVKLMAAVGAFIGMPALLDALFYAVFFGGVYAALVLLWRGELSTLAADVTQLVTRTGRAGTSSTSSASGAPGASGASGARIVPRGGSFPFGVAIALGTAVALANVRGF